MRVLISCCVTLLLAGVAPASEDVRIPFTGTVVDAEGRPIEGAQVWIGQPGGRQPSPAVETTTDEAGRFAAAVSQDRDLLSCTVWAWRDGLAPDWRQVDIRKRIAPGEVRLTLRATHARTILLLDPAGEPLPGQAVRIAGLSRPTPQNSDGSSVPPPLQERFTLTTGDDGRCKFDGAAAEHQFSCRVATPECGEQFFFTGTDAAPDAEWPLRLLPVGRVVGRLLSDDPAVISGARIIAHTRVESPGEHDPIGSNAEVLTDEAGRFELPAMAAGTLTLYFAPPAGAPARPAPFAPRPLAAGETLEVEIGFLPTARVRGSVRSQDGQAVAGAKLFVQSKSGEEVVYHWVMETDAEGRYDHYAAAGQVAVWIADVPEPYVDAWRSEARTAELAGGAEHDFESIVVERGLELRGTVIDDADAPVPGAQVAARWRRVQGSSISEGESAAVCDERGTFAIVGIHGGATVSLSARLADASTDQPLEIVADGQATATVRISTEWTVAVSGRVVDRAGRGIAGARLWFPDPTEGGRPRERVTRTIEAVTDADGRFVTPNALKRFQFCQVRAEADGFLPVSLDWFRPQELDDNTLPDIVLPRLRTVSGRVVDRRGERLAGAVVHQSGDGPQPTETTTDDDGRFRLEGVPDTDAFLFAEAAGYRFHGQPVAGNVELVELVLTRRDEPVEPRRTLPALYSPQERREIAVAVLTPFVLAAMPVDDQRTRIKALSALADIDVALAEQAIDDHGLARLAYAPYLTYPRIEAALRADVETALPLIAALRDARSRSYRYVEAADALPGDAVERKVELLNLALREGREDAEPTDLVLRLGMIGERLLDLGRRDEATALLREGEALARELPNEGRAGFARGWIAEELAQIDVPAALALMHDLADEHEYNRHHANMAHELGALDPAAAERVLGMVRDEWYRSRTTQRICHRMAPVDLPRARRLAAALGDLEDRTAALLAMADGLAEHDKPTAESLLHEALAVLRTRDEWHWSGQHSAEGMAGWCVVVGERIDPQLVAEFAWQAMTFRESPYRPSTPRIAEDWQGQAHLALTLARYDRDLARAVLAPVADRVRAASPEYGPIESLFVAAAEIDPRWAAELVERLPPPMSASSGERQHAARIAVAKALSRHDDARWTVWQQEHLRLWPSHVEDY